jgi:hypothetical protein
MTAPAPLPGTTNPFLLAYQTRQFGTAEVGNPASVGGPENIAVDYLATVPSVTINAKTSSATAAATADWNKYKKP